MLYMLRKTKVLISCMVTMQLVCTFVFTYAKSRFSHDAAHMCPSKIQFQSVHPVHTPSLLEYSL